MFSRFSGPSKSKAFQGGRLAARTRLGLSTRCKFFATSSNLKPRSVGLNGVSAFILGSLFTAGTGFYFLKDQLYKTTLELEYGSARDFQTAIQELQAIFPAERVSTDDADLHDHGFSLNDYHPGA